MEGVDRLNELKDEMLVNNIMYRLNCTTKELIRTTATISKRWKNLWTQLPHLIFSDEDDITDFGNDDTDCDYISFIDNTINQCPANLNLKKFKLDIDLNSEFKSRANSWIRYAIRRNVEEIDLCLFDVGVGQGFTFEDELFFNTSCITRMTLSFCRFNPPNGAISWERLECLCLYDATLDEDMIEKILSGSPCLESLDLNDCHGFRRIDVTSKSLNKLVFSEYCSDAASEEDYIECIKINAPYISSLTIKGELYLRELVLLNVSSLVEVDLKYSISYEEFVKFAEEIFRGLLESLGHVENITFGDHCLEMVVVVMIELKMEIVRNKLLQVINLGVGVLLVLIPLVACGLLNVPFAVALQKFQLQSMSAQDKRLKFTSEILNNMKIIKLQSCAWREFCEGMAAAGSFDEMIEVHEAYLLSIQLQCFFVPDKLWALIASRINSILTSAGLVFGSTDIMQ
ncbi:ribonuclease H-like domain-containing protein [Tanacetum coccineum]